MRSVLEEPESDEPPVLPESSEDELAVEPQPATMREEPAPARVRAESLANSRRVGMFTFELMATSKLGYGLAYGMGAPRRMAAAIG